MQKSKSKYIWIPLSACFLMACAADFGFEAPGNGRNIGADEPCDCTEPHPNPTPPPGGRKPPCPTPRPAAGCDLRVFVNVAEVHVERVPGRKQVLPVRPGEIDLCELSKDFFGTLNRRLAPAWLAADSFSKIDFILTERTGTNRVESQAGVKICSLRLPPGPTAGLRLETVGRDPIRFDVQRTVTFAFDETDALHELGLGLCQLQHPVGHYDLK